MKKVKYLDTDIEIIIRYATVDVHYMPDAIYDEEDRKNIEFAVKTFSREIAIDQTYVAYNDSKYDKVFLTEHGWLVFCKILKTTKYGKKANAEQHEMLQTAYCLMIISYIYMCLEDFGYDSTGIYLDIPNKSYYMVEIKTNICNRYIDYPGKWQSWNV